MNFPVMRCVVGLFAWSALAGQVTAQAPSVSGSAKVSDLPPTVVVPPTPTPYGFSGPLSSGPVEMGQLQSGQVSPGNYFGTTGVDQVFSPAFRVDARGGNQYGYNGGFTSFSGMLPYLVDRDTLLFADVRGFVTDYSRGGANVGVGWRYYDEEIDRIWGVSGWYDNDGGHQRRYNQFGVSLESLGRYVDYRVNGYIPFGTRDNVVSATADPNSLFFQQSNLLFRQFTGTETAYSGFDAEIGGPMPLLGRYGLNGYVGTYYFVNNKNNDLNGVSGRFLQRVNEDWTIGVNLTHDNKFGSNAQIQVTVTLPDGMPSKWLRQRRVYERLIDPVFRNYRVTAGVDVIASTEKLINPRTGLPYFVAHIDPNLLPAGTGTVETPYDSLASFSGSPLKSTYDIVYVRPRTDGTSTNLNTGVQLDDFQRLLSTSVSHSIAGQSSTLPLTTFNLPAIAGTTASSPLLQNLTVGSPVVRLANQNEVSGFAIDGTSSGTLTNFRYNNGIQSQPGTINGFNINNNQITNTLDAIRIASNTTGASSPYSPGLGIIQNNVITGNTQLLDPVTSLPTVPAGFGSNNGIALTHSGGTLNLRVAQNSISNIRGEDRNNSGTLNVTGLPLTNEDTNGDGLLDIGIAMDIRATGAGSVINAQGTAPGFFYNGNSPGTLTPIPVTLGINDNPLRPGSGSTLNNNGAGIRVTADKNSTIGLDMNRNLVENSRFSTTDPTVQRGFGILGQALNGGTLNVNTFSGNSTTGGAQDGTVIQGVNGSNVTFTNGISGQVFSNSGGDGLAIISNNSTVIVPRITGSTFSNNGANGLRLQTDNGGTLTVTEPLSGNQFGDTFAASSPNQGNQNNGLAMIANTGTINAVIGLPTDVATASGGTNSFNGNGRNGTGNGLLMQVTGPGVINSGVYGAQATRNGGSGLRFDINPVVSPATVPGGPGGAISLTGLNGNLSTNNTVDGVQINNTNGGVFTTPNISNNDFSNNVANGMSLNSFSGAPPQAAAANNLGNVSNNNFNRDVRGTVGMFFNTTNVTTNAILTQNSFVGRLAAAGPPAVAGSGRGIGGTINGGGLNLSLVPVNTTTNPTNVFTNNGDAQIGLVFSGASVNNFTMSGHTLNGTVNSSNASETLFEGDGVGLVVRDTATLGGFIEASTITNNARNGIYMEASGSGAGTFASITNFRIGGTSPTLGNVISNNGTGPTGGNGIFFNRIATGQVNNALIQNNTIENNVTNGIFLAARNADTLDTYTISDNIIRRTNAVPNQNGIRIDVQADADIQADIARNTITGNSLNGILTTEVVNSPSDSRSVRGTWQQNLITDNGLDGIQLSASSANLLVGNTTQRALGNFISRNGRNGINVTGSGTATFSNNVITLNGVAGTLGTVNETAGIRMNAAPNNAYIVSNNDISDNRGDGIQYGIPNNFSGFFGSIVIDGNNIAYNDGRGVDLLNGNNNFTRAAIRNNIITANRLEGIYVVNTAATDENQLSRTRTQLGGATFIDMSQNGPLNSNPILEIDITGNQVIGNGADSGLTATGVVVRVGTSDNSQSFTDPGGFASTGGVIAVGGSAWGTSSFRGGVSMVFDNNTLGGNFGDDILMQSFVSTVAPPVTNGAWDNTQFVLNAPYESDPLARLDLHYRNNVIDTGASDVNNQFGVGSANIDRVAYYNTAEGVFKSRLNNIAAPNIAGPFDNASRRRNAQRQAARIPSLNAPLVGPGLTFLYPGIGRSTFRVSTDSDTSTFLLDTNPYTNTGNASGYLLPGAGIGELPFGWGSF